MNTKSNPTITGQVINNEKDILNNIFRIRKDISLFFDRAKTTDLFVELIDADPDIDFSHERYRKKIDKFLPTFRIKINWANVIGTQRVTSRPKTNKADDVIDWKVDVVHHLLIKKFLEILTSAVLEDDHMQLLKEEKPDDYDIANFLMTNIFTIRTTESMDSVIIIKPFL